MVPPRPLSSLQLLLVLFYTFHGLSCQQSGTHPSNVTEVRLCSGQPYHLSSLDAWSIPTGMEWNTTLDIVLSAGISALSSGKEFADIREVRVSGANSSVSEVRCQGNNTGIRFTRVHRVRLERITLNGCGMSHQNGEWKASLLIVTSNHVTIVNMSIGNPIGMGVALMDVANSAVTDCTFETDICGENFLVAGTGLYVEASYNRSISLVVNNCVFSRSCGERESVTPCWDQGEGLVVESVFSAATLPSAVTPRGGRGGGGGGGGGRGGGIRILLGSEAIRNSIVVTDCRFEGNTGDQGGAVYIGIQDGSVENTITVSASDFRRNCAESAGGAIAVGFLSASPRASNKMSVTKCNFTGNSAPIGGAVHVSYSETDPACNASAVRNGMEFSNCTWAVNTAHEGAAIHVRPTVTRASSRRTHKPPLVTLMGCAFEQNSVVSIIDGSLSMRGQGTIKLESAELWIKGRMHMEANTGSALYLESTTAHFLGGSESFFTGNEGYHGGAIAITGVQRSRVSVQGDVTFQANWAASRGGAIYQEHSNECFISRSDDQLTTGASRKGTLQFDNNTAGDDIGHSIFVNSLKACFEVPRPAGNYCEALDSMARFEFMQNRLQEVATLGKQIVRACLPDHMIPGKTVNIIVCVLDDTNSTRPTTDIKISATNHADIDVVVGFSKDGPTSIKVLGAPGSSGEIRITYNPQHRAEFMISITLSACPPGYYHNIVNRSCECSVFSEKHRYIGIQACEQDKFQANLLHSHWAGYIREKDEEGTVTGIVFKTAYCPRGYCTRSEKMDKDVLLPSHVENNDLSSLVCRENRIGILCSRCTANHSSFFPRVSCERDNRCNLGWLFYILSQIIPVTIIFSLLLVFDISLTSGWLNGAIFYMQMIDALVLTANDFIWFEPPVYSILRGLRVISRAMSLSFFALGDFSFCLWQGATALDMFAFNYVTITYSFLIVIFTVKVASPLVQRIKKHCWRKTSNIEQVGSSSIIHGLTGFLVLCYSQNTQTSLNLLNYVVLHGQGDQKEGKLRVFYMGDLGFLSTGHLQYAIPALTMLFVITVLPLSLLLTYPLCYRVLAVCRLQESKVTKILCRVVPLERYKPFFDAFQGSFRDRHRHFAGLYFAYRLIWLITVAFMRELATLYVLLEMELIVMLAISAYFQPYKLNWHNRLDTLVFVLLALINGCTIYSYHKRNDYTHPSDYIQVVNTIQIMLTCLPPLGVVGYLAWLGVTFIRGKWRRNRGETDRGADVIEIDIITSGRRDEDLEESTQNSYRSNTHYRKLPNTN